ncbi:hypothetical protein GGI43DRAFT_404127 [Trichoderma evansii]
MRPKGATASQTLLVGISVPESCRSSTLIPLLGPVGLVRNDVRRKGGVERRVGAVHGRIAHKLGDYAQVQGLVARQAGDDVTGIDRHAGDALGSVVAAVLNAQNPGARLAQDVALGILFWFVVVEVVGGDSHVPVRGHLHAERAIPDDARQTVVGDESRREQWSQQVGGHAFDAQAELVALRSYGNDLGEPTIFRQLGVRMAKGGRTGRGEVVNVRRRHCCKACQPRPRIFRADT